MAPTKQHMPIVKPTQSKTTLPIHFLLFSLLIESDIDMKKLTSAVLASTLVLFSAASMAAAAPAAAAASATAKAAAPAAKVAAAPAKAAVAKPAKKAHKVAVKKHHKAHKKAAAK